MPLFPFFGHKKIQQELSQQVKQLQDKMTKLETELHHLEEKQRKEHPAVHVDNIQVDQLIVERLELNNTFGQLGIKELTGKLNIGATTYGNWPLEDEGSSDSTHSPPNSKPTESQNNAAPSSPKIHMRARKNR